jgi:DNA-binding SARP family transcriptional activator
MDEVAQVLGSRDDASLLSWELSLLGAWRLCAGGAAVDIGSNGQRLLALLAVHGACDRSYLAGVLWPNCSEQHAHGNLRATLSRLHRRNVEHAIQVDNKRVLSLADQVRVDVRDLIATASGVLDGSYPSPGRWTLRELCASDLLVGWYDDWVLRERDRIRQLRLHALEELSDQLLTTGNATAAAEAALEAVAVEPLRESAHRAVIRALLVQGNRGEALRQFGKLQRLLLDELGIQPSALVAELFA